MEEEVTCIKEKMNVISSRKICNIDFYIGTFSGSPNSVFLARSGMGKVNAAICTQILIDMMAVDAVINTGVAGSMRNDIHIGDIVISKNTRYHDFDTTEIGDEPGIISRMDTSIFEGDPTLIATAQKVAAELGVQNFTGLIVSGDQFVANGEHKKAICDFYAPLCCDMESAAIGHTCYLNNVPFVNIRAISDNAEDNAVVDYPTFFASMAEIAGNIVEKISCSIA